MTITKRKTKLPVYVDSEHLHFYESRQDNSIPKLKVKRLKNVFVSHEGLCLRNFRLVPKSAFNINSKYDNKFGWQYYRLAIEQFLVSTFGKSLQKENLSKKTKYGLIHTKWFNYSFWITSSLNRLELLLEQGEGFELIFPENWESIPYIVQSLEAYPNIKKRIVAKGVHLQVPQLLMPEVRPYTACFDSVEIQKAYNRIISYLPKKEIALKPVKRIYLTRKKAQHRKVENEQEFIDKIEKYDFTVLDFDELTFWEQVFYMNNADVFMSIHGAGFSNIMFMKEGAKVMELINLGYANLEYTFPFWKLATEKKLHYFAHFCEPKEYNNKSIKLSDSISSDFLVNQNILIDYNKFIPELERLIEYKNE